MMMNSMPPQRQYISQKDYVYHQHHEPDIPSPQMMYPVMVNHNVSTFSCLFFFKLS